MEIIIFLYVVGYMIGLGSDFADNECNFPMWVILIGNLFTWPMTIGRAITK